jgi:hypothetical protein
LQAAGKDAFGKPPAFLGADEFVLIVADKKLELV